MIKDTEDHQVKYGFTCLVYLEASEIGATLIGSFIAADIGLWSVRQDRKMS